VPLLSKSASAVRDGYYLAGHCLRWNQLPGLKTTSTVALLGGPVVSKRFPRNCEDSALRSALQENACPVCPICVPQPGRASLVKSEAAELLRSFKEQISP